MSCELCGTRTTGGRLCSQCAMMERCDEDVSHDHSHDEHTPACFACDEPAPNGEYDPDEPGVWLCQSCLGDDDECDSTAEAPTAVATDGGIILDDDEDGDESDIIVAGDGAEVLTDGGEDVSEDELPRLHIGDQVTDRDEGEEAATMLVVGLDTLQADAYPLGDEGPTVADVNPGYPETDDVVEVTFPQRTDMDVDNKRYAYPRSRLQLKRPIHNRDGDGEFDDDAVPTWGAVKTLAEHIVESHTNIDDRLNEIEGRLDRAERDIDTIDGGI